MDIKPKHLEFALHYLRTKDPEVSYKMAYPRAGMKSLSAAASRLLARPDVASVIKHTESRIQERALREVEDEKAAELKHRLLTINEKRDVLAKIITGQRKRTRHFKTKYGYSSVQDDLPVYAVIRAIDMDTRLEMFYNFLIGQNNPAGKKQSNHFYVNAPTLQQQVNILISQTQDEPTETPPIDTPEHSPQLSGQEAPATPVDIGLLKKPPSPVLVNNT